MSAPKRTPRERLLDRFRSARPHMADAGERAAFARTLRAHERELAKRADAALYRHAPPTMLYVTRDALRWHVRAAILQRSATPKAVGPKRGRR